MWNDQEVRDILSQQHLLNTARGLNKSPESVTANDLIYWWKRFHSGIHIAFYDVADEEMSDDNQMWFV